MFELKIDTSDFERQARAISGGIEQLPFALSRTLNEFLKVTRGVLVTHTWPKSVTVRNKGFLNAALHMEFSDKHNLSVAITDGNLPGRAHLVLHADAGTKSARSNFAIPSKNVRIGAHGVVASQRARVLPNTFRKGDTIFQRVKNGKKTGLKLMFTLRSSIFQPADVPFRADFAELMLYGVKTLFPPLFAKALLTAR